MNKIKKRLSEPSTWIGLSALITGVGLVGKINEAPVIAETVETVGQGVVTGMSTGDWTLSISAIIAAIIGIFKGEKDSK